MSSPSKTVGCIIIYRINQEEDSHTHLEISSVSIERTKHRLHDTVRESTAGRGEIEVLVTQAFRHLDNEQGQAVELTDLIRSIAPGSQPATGACSALAELILHTCEAYHDKMTRQQVKH